VTGVDRVDGGTWPLCKGRTPAHFLRRALARKPTRAYNERRRTRPRRIVPLGARTGSGRTPVVAMIEENNTAPQAGKDQSGRMRLLALLALLAALALALLSLRQGGAAGQAQALIDRGDHLARAIVSLASDGPNDLLDLAWQVSENVLQSTRAGQIGWTELARMEEMVRQAHAASTFEAKRQALDQMSRLTERRRGAPR